MNPPTTNHIQILLPSYHHFLQPDNTYPNFDSTRNKTPHVPRPHPLFLPITHAVFFPFFIFYEYNNQAQTNEKP